MESAVRRRFPLARSGSSPAFFGVLGRRTGGPRVMPFPLLPVNGCRMAVPPTCPSVRHVVLSAPPEARNVTSPLRHHCRFSWCFVERDGCRGAKLAVCFCRVGVSSAPKRSARRCSPAARRLRTACDADPFGPVAFFLAWRAADLAPFRRTSESGSWIGSKR